MSNGKRLFLTAITVLSFIIFQSSLSASEDNVDTLKDPLTDFKVDKGEILKSLDQLKKDGKINDKDYNDAKKQLMGMNDSQVNGLKDQAINMVRKNPDKAVELYTTKKIDPKKVEQQAKEANP